MIHFVPFIKKCWFFTFVKWMYYLIKKCISLMTDNLWKFYYERLACSFQFHWSYLLDSWILLILVRTTNCNYWQSQSSIKRFSPLFPPNCSFLILILSLTDFSHLISAFLTRHFNPHSIHNPIYSIDYSLLFLLILFSFSTNSHLSTINFHFANFIITITIMNLCQKDFIFYLLISYFKLWI